MGIEARTTRLLLRLWHALSQQGGGTALTTEIGTLNTSNAAASSPSIPYTLPTDGYTIEVTGQVPQMPDKGLRRITLTSTDTPQDVIGLSGFAQSVASVWVSCFLSYAQLTVTDGSGWTAEQILQCAGLDLAECVRRTLTAAPIQSAAPAENIARVVRSSVSHRLELVGEDGRPQAVRAGVLVTYEQLTDF